VDCCLFTSAKTSLRLSSISLMARGIIDHKGDGAEDDERQSIQDHSLLNIASTHRVKNSSCRISHSTELVDLHKNGRGRNNVEMSDRETEGERRRGTLERVDSIFSRLRLSSEVISMATSSVSATVLVAFRMVSFWRLSLPKDDHERDALTVGGRGSRLTDHLYLRIFPDQNHFLSQQGGHGQHRSWRVHNLSETRLKTFYIAELFHLKLFSLQHLGFALRFPFV
jgi:hypothetical protein